MSKDLWGDLPGASDIITPVDILKEQAVALRTKTKNRLSARVNPLEKPRTTHPGGTYAVSHMLTQPSPELESMDFHYSFELNAPALNNYTYTILEIAYSIDMYPVLVFDWSSKQTKRCADIDSYQDYLETILQSEKTRSIIALLLKQAGP